VDSGDKSVLDKAPESDEEATGGVNAFGIHSSRSVVNWRSPKLMGQQQIGANTVDLSQQIGVYLLYDGREFVYVGRSTDRPINQRLLERTRDRLQARWNRFSWFGLYPVKENGKLITELPPLDSAELIRTLEAVLIELMEPGQNRERGDIFSSIEYIQVTDPKIAENNRRSLLEELLEGVKAR
jgi:hypothetical protein